MTQIILVPESCSFYLSEIKNGYYGLALKSVYIDFDANALFESSLLYDLIIVLFS